MEKSTNLRNVTNKKGSYILESTIALPVFMIAIVVMSSIILMFSCIEDANFIMANEIRRSAAEAIVVDSSILLPERVENKITSNHSQVANISMMDYCYRAEKWNQDELILLKYQMLLETKSPLNLASRASYDVSLVTRAYVGKERVLDNMSEEEMNADASPVYIFPKRGEKYHSRDCRVLTLSIKSGILNGDIKGKYKACSVCHSKKAEPGSKVYYFPDDGEAYHVEGCPVLERNYIEVEKRVAVKRGYTACSKCGG